MTERARRAQIVTAAIAVIAESGYGRASFARIAERAGLSSTGLISYHFANRGELMEQVAERVIGAITEFMGDRMTGATGAADALRRYIEGNAAFVETHRAEMKALLEIFLGGGFSYDAGQDREAKSPVEQILRAGQASGEFRDFDVTVMATMIQRAVDGLPFLLTDDPGFDTRTYAAEVITAFELATRAGAVSGTTPAAKPESSRRTLPLLVLDLGAPIGLYYGLHGAGVSTLVALGAGALVPAVGVIVQLITRRRLDGVGGVVVVSVLATIALSLVTGNPRFLLAREGFITALWGLWFLATVRAARPAAFQLARPLMEGRRAFGQASWDELWATEPAFGRIWRVSTVMWGAGLLVDAIVRVLMSYTLPVSVVPGLGGALWPVTFIVLQVVTNVYYHRAGLYRMLGAPWISRGTDDLIKNESNGTAIDQAVSGSAGRGR